MVRLSQGATVGQVEELRPGLYRRAAHDPDQEPDSPGDRGPHVDCVAWAALERALAAQIHPIRMMWSESPRRSMGRAPMSTRVQPPPAESPAHAVWWRPARADWWMGVLFAIGSTCFAVASFVSQWASVPRPGVGVTFFVGSIFFTSAAFVQLRTSVTRTDRTASLIQFAGTLFFNVSTFEGMKRGFDARQTDLRVWTPDVFGSICFLVSSALAYLAVRRPSTAWRIAALNLLGSVFFGISAVAALVEPSTTEPVSAAVANAGTTAGALCFFAGALMLISQSEAPAAPA